MIDEPIFYATPDPVRAIGLEKILPHYHIVCLDDSPFVDLLLEKNLSVFSLEKALKRKNIVRRNTGFLLDHPRVGEYIQKNSAGKRPHILFFKPSKKIETVCERNGYLMLGNKAYLNSKYEDKISFFRECQALGLPTPPAEIIDLHAADYQKVQKKYGPKIVIQFGHGWAGNTTFIIESQAELATLKKRFGRREVKISSFILGATYLNNACVTEKEVLVGPPARQITAPAGFTANPGGTCGRQWPAELGKETERQIEKYTVCLGEAMRQEGYRGFFGLDFLLEEKSGRVFLSECNARLTASVSLFTQMEIATGQTPLLLYHILAFLQKPEIPPWKKVELSGVELVIRNNAPSGMVVNHEVRSGIYHRHDARIDFKMSDYSLANLQEDDFFLLAAEKGRILTPEAEVARLETFSSLLKTNGEIQDWAKNFLQKVKEDLKLLPHDYS